MPSSSLILNYYFPRQTGRLPAPWGNFYGLKDKLYAVKIINFYSIPNIYHKFFSLVSCETQLLANNPKFKEFFSRVAAEIVDKIPIR